MFSMFSVIDWRGMLWFTSVTITIHFSMVTILSAFYALIEYYSLFQEARIQKTPPTKASNPTLKDCIMVALKTIFLLELFSLPPIYMLLSQRMNFSGPPPSWTELAIHIPVCILVEDTLFYWLHRLLHQPFLYKHIHKMHHQYHQPIPLAYQYIHPVENFLTAGIPLFTGPFLLKSHVYTFWVWLCIRILEALDGHSGYDLWFMPFRYFPFRPGAQVHDYHHSHNVGNYGSFFTLWDKLCGTDCSYWAHKESKNNDKQIITS